ncbi:MBL fold metallo-hydrolase [Corynebacterium sp. 35RC1]|nr:MBL fold metallo-hydrolase [Corynebacterium sp. 35RC1]
MTDEQHNNLPTLHLDQISVGDMDNNCYLLYTKSEGTDSTGATDSTHPEHTGQALLVDAADNAHAILQLAEQHGVKITAVLTTHRHHDHVRALKDVLAATGATHYAPFLDAPALPAEVDVELHEGNTIPFAGRELKIHILRGHTPGGAALVAELEGVPHIFIGDSLFPGGLGKTTSESEFERLFHDVKQQIFDQYPDNTVIHPGHGASTTLGKERPELEDWWERRW